jgi:hypothetical protein
MSATEAYKLCGYSESTAGRNVWHFMKKYEIREIIEERLADYTKEVSDHIKMKSQDALDVAYRIMTTGENEFARLKAAQDILDRSGLKPAEKVDQNHSGTVKIEFEYFDTPQETEIDDLGDENETISE